MVSAFASQLQAIASKSSHELDLKARRNAHAESLLFDRDIAVKQDFETIYNICVEGFYELCQLDSRFRDFERNLFAEHSKNQDREELNKSQNEALNLALKRCLMLLGGKSLLKPALKALEWLVRRFRVHVHNIDDLLSTVLPYHEVSVWANTLSIIPSEKIPSQWKFVRPYLKTTWNVPRHAVAYAASHNDAFFATLTSYALELCRHGFANSIYMTFWSGIVVEAISSRLAQTRSGRKEVQTQRVEDLLLKVLPLLSEGYEIPGSTDMITTCYTITIILAAKAELADHLLDSLLLAVCQSFDTVDHERSATMATAAVLASYKENPILPKKVLEILSNQKDFGMLIRATSEKQSTDRLLRAALCTVMSQIKRKNAERLASFTFDVISLLQDLYPANLVIDAMTPLASKVFDTSADAGLVVEVRNELISLVQKVSRTPDLSHALSEALVNAGLDAEVLESLLGMTIDLPEASSRSIGEDTPMEDAYIAIEPPVKSLGSMPSVWEHESSFLTTYTSSIFIQVSEIFESCAFDPEQLEKFQAHSFWSSTTNKRLLWQSFLIRFASSTGLIQVRQKALHLLALQIKEQPACEVQFFIPYVLMLLTDVKAIRQSASNVLNIIQESSASGQTGKQVSEHSFYNTEATKQIILLPQKQVISLLTDTICPVLEECVLDQTYVRQVVEHALQSSTTTDVKKSHRLALFSLMTQHALATPLIRLKVSTISMLSTVQKVGGKSKTKTLQPILQQWLTTSNDAVDILVRESGLSVQLIDEAFVMLTDAHDGHYLEAFATTSAQEARPGLVRAFFEHTRCDWNLWTSEQHVASAETLFKIAFSTNEILSAGAQEVLRSVDLSSETLAILLQIAEDGTSNVRGPPSKKKRRSSSGASQSRIDVIKTIDNTTAKISFVLELVDSNSPESKSELVTVMFEMLACLRQLQQNRIESPYLLNLCLSSILAMVQPLAIHGKSADVSGIRPELITECLRSSENPQVQNTSLLLLAALSSVVPDRMVHNVMPIFTFIGHNMVSKDDEHSINVVNEAIDKIVPALLQSLRRGSNPQTYQASMSTMLANFTSAYEHIPRPRRVAFYQKLLSSVNADEFGYVLIALLASQEGKMDSFNKFLEDLSSTLPAPTQLVIYQQLIKLSVDALSASPKISVLVFNIVRSTSVKDKNSYAKSSLHAAVVMLRSPDLSASIGGGSRVARNQIENVKQPLRSSFETTLHAIEDLKGSNSDALLLVKQCLDALLQLPRLVDLLAMLESTLDDMEETQLRPQALRVLALQLQEKHKKDSGAKNPALSLIRRLIRYVDPQQNAALVQASLACANCIVEVYGRKDPEAVLVVAESILSHGLAPFKKTPKVMEAAILTIASVVEVVKEASVALVMGAVSQTLGVLQPSASSQPSLSLFNSACTLLSALVSNVAFMISEEQIATILSALLAPRENPDSQLDDTDFSLLIRSMAHKVELDVLLGASMAVLDQQKETQASASGILLNMVQQAIDISPKSVVVRNAESISELFERMLGIEAGAAAAKGIATTHDEGERRLTDELKATSIKFIYKINDTTFRPIFESWVDWASSPETEDISGRASRQEVLFELLVHFFDNLKAIVTSYASYLLTPLSRILQSATNADNDIKPSDGLLIKTLSLLGTIATYDQDSFFSAPSNFEPVADPLVSLLRLASTKSRRSIVSSHVIPTIIALATATMDSPNTHSALVHSLVGFKPHSSARVRLASIQTLIAVTEDEDVGDEFLANTIGIGLGEGEGARGGGSSVGEIMVYVNEMLEDDDEDVEREVRRWVQMVRAKVGEDIFEI